MKQFGWMLSLDLSLSSIRSLIFVIIFQSSTNVILQVMQFLSRQKHSKKYVLVHCTHGHNRTGFMIVHFLMRTQLLHVADVWFPPKQYLGRFFLLVCYLFIYLFLLLLLFFNLIFF